MKSKTVLFIVGGIGGVMCLMIAVCCGGIYLFFSNASADLSPPIDNLMAALVTGDVAASYENDTTAQLKQVTTLAQYEQLAAAIRNHLGNLKSKTTTSINLRNDNGQSMADVSYRAVFEKGDGTIQASLQKVDGQWKFVSFHVTSPNFEKALANTPEVPAP